MIDMSEARRLMELGLSDREVGERLGCSKQRIHTLRQRWQLPQRVQVMEARIKKGYESGLTRKEIQWRLGLTRDQVDESITRLGIAEQDRLASHARAQTTCAKWDGDPNTWD